MGNEQNEFMSYGRCDKWEGDGKGIALCTQMALFNDFFFLIKEQDSLS